MENSQNTCILLLGIYLLQSRARDFIFLDEEGSVSVSLIHGFLFSSVSLLSLSRAELAAATSIFKLVVGVRGAVTANESRQYKTR